MRFPAFLPTPPLLLRNARRNETKSSRPFLHHGCRRIILSHASAAPYAASSAPTTPDNSAEYDYVIVGGGAAGCVLANRLSSDRNATVLVLEAGGPADDFYLHVPLGFPYLLGSACDWAFLTEPEPHLNGRRLYFPRGRVLGGSHAISVMLYHRGDPGDYRAWEAAGADGWGPEEVLPYFRRSERQMNPKADPNFTGLKAHLPSLILPASILCLMLSSVLLATLLG